ncbi:MAG: sensor domain-containing diguanylate cyclase [Deltaproteobacteria bacterium]|nr:sensor domain-containing diguanylate cyclase [Deltaproteobacteria bacterium]
MGFPRFPRGNYDVIMIGLSADAAWNREVVKAVEDHHDRKRVILMTEGSSLQKVIPLVKDGASNLFVYPLECGNDQLESLDGVRSISDVSRLVSRSHHLEESNGILEKENRSLEESRNIYSFLYEFTTRIHELLDADSIVEAALELLPKMVSADVITFLVKGEKQNHYRIGSQWALPRKQVLLFQRAIRSHLSSWVNGTPDTFKWRFETSSKREVPDRFEDLLGGSLTVPIRSDGQVTGILNLAGIRPISGSKDLSFLVETLAANLGRALKNASTYERTLELAEKDALTGLPNYRATIRRLEQELERTKRYGHTLSVLVIDIDSFKNINDAYGHQTGDLVLREISRIIEQSVRSCDTAGRYAGDEFLIILPETSRGNALLISERIRSRVEKHTWPREFSNLFASVSIGVASSGNIENEALWDLFRTADGALYRAKNRGKNQVCAT